MLFRSRGLQDHRAMGEGGQEEFDHHSDRWNQTKRMTLQVLKDEKGFEDGRAERL